MGTTVPCLASWARSAVFSWFRVAMTVAGRFKSLAQLCDLACFRVEFGAQRVGRLAVLRLFGCRLSGLLNGGSQSRRILFARCRVAWLTST
jgi:hypothetical protein